MPDRALLTVGGQAVSPLDIYAFGGPGFCPLLQSTRTQVKESVEDVRVSSLLRQSRGSSTQMSVDENDHPTSIVADGVEQTVHWRLSSMNGISLAGGVGDPHNSWSGFCSPCHTGYQSHTHATNAAGAKISLKSSEARASILPKARGNIESSRSGPSFDMVNPLRSLSRSIDPIESLGVALAHEVQPYRVSSLDFGFITGGRGGDDFPPTSPFISPIPSINFSRVWDRNLTPLARQTRGKRCRLTQDNVHCERNSNEQEPGAEGMHFFPMSSKSPCSYASLHGVVHLPPTISGERKAKRRRLKDNSLPPGLLLAVDKMTSAFDESVSTLAEHLSSMSVTDAERADGRSPSDLFRKYGIEDKLSPSTSLVHLSPVRNIFHPSERAQLKYLRKRRAAEAHRNKHVGEAFPRMKARHRRRALRKANSEPSKPDSRIRQGTPFPHAFLEPLAVTFESEGAYHDWYRCESPEEIFIYDTGEEKQDPEYLEDPAAIIDQPARRLLFCHDASGSVRTPSDPCDTGHHVEMCMANVSSTSAH